jgi:uncharacterized protein (TIGR04255 family)
LLRPKDLPDFSNPPIIEAVLGVQFATPSGYREIYARDVWSLFEQRFGRVEEHQALEPVFELFGAADAQRVQIKLEAVRGPIHNRFWFVGEGDRELIQFQRDRFIHNWRKIGAKPNDYPRFEPILDNFRQELSRLDQFFQNMGWGQLSPNQCELTYVNRIALGAKEDPPRSPSHYFKRLNLSLIGEPSAFAIDLQQHIRDDSGKPIGRLHVAANSQIGPGGQRAVALNLTARGAPRSADIQGVVEFLMSQRVLVVKTFTEITSEAAHVEWGRTQ